MISIKVNTICGKLREVSILCDNTVVNTGTLNDKEAFEIAEQLFDAARELMVGIDGNK